MQLHKPTPGLVRAECVTKKALTYALPESGPNARPAIVLSVITTRPEVRRRGLARDAIVQLHQCARQVGHLLVIENVRSDAIHRILQSLGGQPLEGCRAGQSGCHYWIPWTVE